LEKARERHKAVNTAMEYAWLKYALCFTLDMSGLFGDNISGAMKLSVCDNKK